MKTFRIYWLKMKVPLTLICILIGTNAFPSPPRQSSTGKVFLLGGAMSDDTASIYNTMKAATGKPEPKIVVAISAAGSLEVGLEAYYVDYPDSWSYERLFTFYGFQPSVLHLAMDNYLEGSSNRSAIGQENIRLVEEADLVFFNGGDQSRHARSWFNDDGTDSDIMTVLRRKFAEGTVVAGTSAGAAIMGEETYGEGYSYGYYYFNADLKPCRIGETLQDDREGEDSFRYDENGGYMQGFGFIQGALVDTHFDARGRLVRLPAAMKSTGKSYGYGVGEDTAVFINGSIATVYGNDGAWFMDSTEAFFVNETYFTMWDLKGSYLTAGDSIDLLTKEITTTKSIIERGNGNPHKSNDIFRGGEAVRCATSLMSSSVTLGQVTGESSESNPTTNVIFYKGRGETGYYSDATRKYTITNMFMDVRTL